MYRQLAIDKNWGNCETSGACSYRDGGLCHFAICVELFLAHRGPVHPPSALPIFRTRLASHFVPTLLARISRKTSSVSRRTTRRGSRNLSDARRLPVVGWREWEDEPGALATRPRSAWYTVRHLFERTKHLWVNPECSEVHSS
jgi:hypothetical protein